MSGPVFVVDNLGTALMPLAEAHARKLLHSNKAQIRPHPALTIIQLNRVVECPILRPICVGIRIHQTTAELFVAAAGSHTIFPLLYVVVDLNTRHVWRRGQLPERQMRMYLLDIRATIGVLWLFLPISHVVIFNTSTSRDQMPSDVQRLKRYLSSDKLHVAIAHREDPTPPGIPPKLFDYLVRLAAQPPLPALVAVPVEPLDSAAIMQRTAWAANEILIPGIGVVGNPPMTGIVHEIHGDNATELHVPIAVGPTRIVWERVIVEPPATIQPWPVGSVALLPVSTVIAQPGVTRWDDYLYHGGGK